MTSTATRPPSGPALRTAPDRTRARRARARREGLAGLLFLAPSLLHFAVFTGGAVLGSLVISTWRWDLVTPHVGVGLSNYTALFADRAFYTSLAVTLAYCLMTIPLGLGLGLALALALDTKVRGAGLFRFFYFLPYIAPVVAVAILFQWLYATDFGLVNWGLGLLVPGEVRVDWLGDPRLQLLSVALMDVWKNLGWSVTLFSAGLLAIPKEYYEAAAIDGARTFQRFRYITLPLLSPTTFFLVVTGVITSFQVFDSIYLMVGQQPGPLATTYNMYVYQQGFRYSNMGYAAALSWVLCAVIGGITYLQFRYVNKRVTYDIT